MPTYVMSEHRRARKAHIGMPPLCGEALTGSVRAEPELPAERLLCGACAGTAVARGLMSGTEIDALRAREPKVRSTLDNEPIIELLKDGCTDAEIGRRLGLSARTVVRRIRDEMNAFAARSRFQFGYAVAIRDTAREARRA